MRRVGQSAIDVLALAAPLLPLVFGYGACPLLAALCARENRLTFVGNETARSAEFGYELSRSCP